MLRFLLNIVRGYVLIEARGMTKERFLNMASHYNIYIWDIHYERGILLAKVGIIDFKRLKPIAKKTNSKYKIIARFGLPFFINRHRRRKILFFGVPMFVGILYLLTSFVWAIDVTGHEKINYEEILITLEEHGLSFGTFKHRISKLTIEDAMLEKFDNMSFVNIDIRGTRATVSIAENIPPVTIADRTTPIDLVAGKQGVIQSVNVSQGEAKVEPGDVVNIGDLLVTGVVVDENIENATHLVHAIADIYAHVYYIIEFFIPTQQDTFVQTGNISTIYSANILGYNLSMPTFLQNFLVNFLYYDTISTRDMLNFGDNYPLPFVLTRTTYKEQTVITQTRDEATLQSLAQAKITQAILNYYSFDVDIVEKQVATTWSDQGLDVSAVIITLQNITQEREIEIEIITPQESDHN